MAVFSAASRRATSANATVRFASQAVWRASTSSNSESEAIFFSRRVLTRLSSLAATSRALVHSATVALATSSSARACNSCWAYSSSSSSAITWLFPTMLPTSTLSRSSLPATLGATMNRERGSSVPVNRAMSRTVALRTGESSTATAAPFPPLPRRPPLPSVWAALTLT